VGRIINRFAKDQGDVDTTLATMTATFFRGFVQLLGALLVIGLATPYTLVMFAPVLCVFYWYQRFFQRTSRELKRLDAVTRSPLYSHIASCLDGLSSIRAYRAHRRLANDQMISVDSVRTTMTTPC
jgi:ABC-type multidrug transport system fused ATPase/permease subunit